MEMTMQRFLEFILRRPEDGTGADGGAPNTDALKEVLAFDPFTPPAKAAQDGGEGGGQEGDEPPGEASAEGSAAQHAEATPSSPQPGQAKPEGEDPLAALREQVAGFLSKAQAPPAETQKPQEPKAPAEPKGTDTKPEAAKYNFEVPDSIVDAMGSDEAPVRKAAVSAMVNALANKLAQDFGGALAALAKHVEEQIPARVLTQVDEKQQMDLVRKDLYENFPELKRLATSMPGMEQAMWGQIAAVGKQMGVRDWTPEFRDGVGKMLHLNLNIPLPASGEPTKQASGKKRAPFSAGSSAGARGNGAAAGNDFTEVLRAGT
jgi:hypothetical protein